MPNRILVTELMLRRVCDHATKQGLDVRAMLDEAGLPPNATDEGLYHPLDDVLYFHRRVAESLGDLSLGLTLASTYPLKEYGVFGYVLQHSTSLWDAIERLSIHLEDLWPDQSFVLREDEDEGRVVLQQCLRERVRGEGLWAQEFFAILVLGARTLLQGALRVQAVAFMQPERDVARFEAVFGVTPTFDAPVNELHLVAEDAHQPIPTADADLLQHLETAVQAAIAQRRQAAGGADSLLELVGCVVDLRRGEVRRGHDSVPLTSKERAVLEYFAARPNQVVTHEQLEQDIWGFGPSVISHAPSVAIRRLRQKIEPSGRKPINLVTVFGESWKLKVADGA